jgi:hypothetical protein
MTGKKRERKTTMSGQNCPMKAKDVIDRYFLESRAKTEVRDGHSDFRYQAILKALHMLTKLNDRRTEAILKNFSDLSVELSESAAELKSACGAWEGARNEDY